MRVSTLGVGVGRHAVAEVDDVRGRGSCPARERRRTCASSTGQGAVSSAGSMFPCSGTSAAEAAGRLVERQAPVDAHDVGADAGIAVEHLAGRRRRSG